MLAPEGEAPSEENAVVVSVTGYEGNQGGFHQSAGFYSCTGGGQRDDEVDGRRAIFTAADEEACTAGSHERAPTVTPPAGWRVLGSVDADGCPSRTRRRGRCRRTSWGGSRVSAG